ncbi:MAG: two-component system sensor histidine kinase CreC, partial [Candidatus Contendobacter sp.]|nr:two-component system sensor histidine kinase CreC [Candidatus Contendobacter sp.]
EAVETMRERLEGRDYVERYVHTLTHEMKSPLAAIAGAAELLQGELPAAQRERFAALAASEAERLRQLVDRLLALATVEQRRELHERRPVALRRIIEELLTSRAPLIARKAVRIENHWPEQAMVWGEPFLIAQALSNLLDNALDFTPAGGVIGLSAEMTGAVWQLTISNSGDPIPDYARDRLFERFYSLPRPDTGRKSTGLGLAFVREVAQLHGGVIVVDNALDAAGRPVGVMAQLQLPAALQTAA